MKFRCLLSLAITWVSTAAYALEGKITANDGKAVIGAEIKVVGKNISTSTDQQGAFSLDINTATELHIIADGFVHKTIHIEKQQLNKTQTIVLTQAIIRQLDVVGIPLHASNIESAMPINVLAGDDLRNKQAATLGDTLSSEVGVHTNFHGNVASTPVIRGLSGPRVLITQNSLDVSDVSRVGPDHSVATEVSSAEQIEILRGPATLFYGSGAIGGVVNVVDKRVPIDAETWGEWQWSHDSVNDQDLAAFNLNTGAENLAFHLDGFWRDANEYHVPVSPEIDQDHGERLVENTAEESSGYTIGSSLILDNGYVGLSFGRLDRDYAIPGHTHGEQEHAEEHHDEPAHDDEHPENEHHEDEQVTLGLKQNRYQFISELNFDYKLLRAINTRLGFTDYDHIEFENGAIGTVFSNKTREAKIEALHQPLSGWNGGLVFDFKRVDFSALGEEAFAPPSKTNSLAIALLEEKHFGDLLFQIGARFEQVKITSNEVAITEAEFHHHDEEEHEDEHTDDEHEDHVDEVLAFDESYNPYSLSAGIVWDFIPGYNIGVSLSHAQRAPSAAELLSFGPHIGTGTFEIGALFELHEEREAIHFEPIAQAPKMEKSNNIDLTFRKFEGDVGLIINAFYNQIENYYTQFDTDLFAEAGHHHDEADEEEAVGEEEHTHAGELPVFLFQSADASLSGFEAQGVWRLNNNLKTTLFADFVRAKLNNGGSLPRIPPLRFGASLDYVNNQLSANLSWIHHADQNDVARLERETEGYDWVDASINYHMPFKTSELTFFVKVANLMDEEARVHSSFLTHIAPRPGRNFRIGVRGAF